MNRELIWLNDILQSIGYIEEDASEGEDSFFSNRRIRDAIIRNFEIIGEVVKRLNPTSIAKFPDIPWNEITQFRDFLIHHYDRVENTTVWEIVQNDLPALKAAVLLLIAEIDNSTAASEDNK